LLFWKFYAMMHGQKNIKQSFLSHYGPGIDSAFNRNEYQVYFLGVKAAGV